MMIKLLTYFMSSGFIVGLFTFGFHFTFPLSTVYFPKLNTASTHTDSLENYLEERSSRIYQLEVMVDDLRIENKILRDSIIQLQFQISDLRDRLSSQTNLVNSIQNRLEVAEIDLRILTDSTSRLQDHGDSYLTDLQKLTQEKALLRAQMVSLKDQLIQQQQAEDELARAVESKTSAEKQYLELAQIIGQTGVQLSYFALKDKLDEPSIHKTNKHWHYTQLHLFLQNEASPALLGKNFRAIIADSDSGLPLRHYSVSEQSYVDHIDFTFNGSMIELTHFNTLSKSGKNFELQLFYIDDKGRAYQLADGVLPLVRNRRGLGA